MVFAGGYEEQVWVAFVECKGGEGSACAGEFGECECVGGLRGKGGEECIGEESADV